MSDSQATLFALCPRPDGPGVLPPAVYVALAWEPLAAADLARTGCWSAYGRVAAQSA